MLIQAASAFSLAGVRSLAAAGCEHAAAGHAHVAAGRAHAAGRAAADKDRAALFCHDRPDSAAPEMAAG